MFRKFKIALFSSLALLQCVAVYVIYTGKIANSLLPERKRIKRSSLDLYPLQYRLDITKDLWIQEGKSRLQYHIESPHSTFFLREKKRKSIEFIESLEQMRLWMQEKLIFQPRPKQEIRYLKAEIGTYNYANSRLDATAAFISTYQTDDVFLTPIKLPASAPFRGIAEKASIFFENNHAIFEAKDFSAYLNPMDIQ